MDVASSHDVSRRSARWRAFLLVTTLAMGAGATLGLVTSGAIVIAAGLSDRALTARDTAGVLFLGAAWGALFGLLLGPATAFVLLRAVPLGRAIVSTAAGSLVGLALTLTLGVNPFFAIPSGFLVGAIYARLRHARRDAVSAAAAKEVLPRTDRAAPPAGGQGTSRRDR
jgi:hypothetical protein